MDAIGLFIGAAIVWLIWRGLRRSVRFVETAIHDIEAYERNKRLTPKAILKRAR